MALDLHKSLEEVEALSPQEWDAWKVYYRRFPRFDPWWAMAMICRVVGSAFGGEARPIDYYYPTVARRPKRKRAGRVSTAAMFDRHMGI